MFGSIAEKRPRSSTNFSSARQAEPTLAPTEPKVEEATDSALLYYVQVFFRDFTPPHTRRNDYEIRWD